MRTDISWGISLTAGNKKDYDRKNKKGEGVANQFIIDSEAKDRE